MAILLLQETIGELQLLYGRVYVIRQSSTQKIDKTAPTNLTCFYGYEQLSRILFANVPQMYRPQEYFRTFSVENKWLVEKSKLQNNVIVSVIILDRAISRDDQFFRREQMFLRLKLFMKR